MEAPRSFVEATNVLSVASVLSVGDRVERGSFARTLLKLLSFRGLLASKRAQKTRHVGGYGNTLRLSRATARAWAVQLAKPRS